MNEGTVVLNPPVDMPEHDAQPVRIIASKPTPGPWGFHAMDNGGQVQFCNAVAFGPIEYYTRHIGRGEVLIGQVASDRMLDGSVKGYPHPSFEEAAANANLVIAAPDLLEAAEFALSVLEKIAFEASEHMAVNKLKAAIAKAYGQDVE